ncbi:MFS transporter [Rhodococcus sp. HNM0569]|uniref:MFS transporter n=1 Tax=Rhodococcus sp. HNM0569 TaxID=2716340 RepID=UPI00146BD03F|nr:MFS transporter [Rhodococcus sp. HNM0569]
MNADLSIGRTVAPVPTSVRPVAGFCVLLAVAATLATGQLFGYLAFLPQLKERFGDEAGLGMPLFAGGYALGMIVLGSLAGRLGARQVLVASLALGGLLSIVTACAPDISLLLGLRFAEGLVLGGFPPAAFVASVQRVPKEKILFANSAMAFGLLGSAGVAGLASHGLASTVGWRTGVVVYGALLLGAAGIGFLQSGIAAGQRGPVHPYRLVAIELTGSEVAFSAGCGALTMATFVTANGLAQQSPHSIASLVVVLTIVLTLLALAKHIVRRPADLRRTLGLVLTLSGAVVVLFADSHVLAALSLATIGATLTVPASIQQVVVGARRAVPVAVAVFTCSLFVGGALAGLVVTGLVDFEISTLALLLVFGLACAEIAALIRRSRTERATRGTI